ncbi:MAG: NusG domain II-containing protein [Firmicutes bacterium]|nr:NusG domain II-containing protein [Bacillota bacterium]
MARGSGRHRGLLALVLLPARRALHVGGLKPADAILLVVLVAVACFASAASSPGGAPVAFVVEAPGQGTVVLPAGQNGLYFFSGPLGRTAVEVAGTSARIVESPCPEPSHHSGGVDEPGEYLVCLPNRIVLRAEGPSGPGGPERPSAGSDAVDAETH